MDEQELSLEVSEKRFGDPDFLLDATTNSSNPVVYISSDIEVLSIDDNLVKIQGAGNVEITALQDPDDLYYEGSTNQTILVNKADQFISFEDVPENITEDSNDFSLVASSTSDLPITFMLLMTLLVFCFLII